MHGVLAVRHVGLTNSAPARELAVSRGQEYMTAGEGAGEEGSISSKAAPMGGSLATWAMKGDAGETFRHVVKATHQN